MKHWKSACATFLVIVSAAFGFAGACVAASPDADLIIAENGSTRPTIVVRAGAGTWEQKAAADLQKYIGLMTGVEPPLSTIVPGGNDPVLLVGESALVAEPGLRPALQRRQKRDALVIPTCTEEHALAQSDVPITGRGPEWVSLRAGWYNALHRRRRLSSRRHALRGRF